MKLKSNITEAIILSSFAFGSVYLYSTTLRIINETYSHDKMGSGVIHAINGLTIGLAGSGIVMLYIAAL